MKPIRILLVDDHLLFRKGLAKLFENQREFHIISEADDGRAAIKKAVELKPDIVLMDIRMPGINGIEATRRIREALPAAKVVMLTAFEEDKYLFEAIKAGAHGYLLKNVRPDSLFETLRGILLGEAAISRITAAKILHEFHIQSRGKYTEYHQEELTNREMEVLKRIAQGVTNKEIAHSLHIAENTVKNHLKSILGKLHLQNRVQLATFAVEKGLATKDHDMPE
jgi:two-component system nitrate/nitrite response regulator NarL